MGQLQSAIIIIIKKIDVEKLQFEAARISAGATKLMFVKKLYDETGWEPLESRRRKHKLTLVYKIFNIIVPCYLADLVPPIVNICFCTS